MTQAGINNTSSSASPGALGPGARLGKYVIVEQLGAGGQSIVYKAHDPLLDRYVAIKQISANMAADEKFIRQFRQVSQQLAKLGCEQVVTIHDLIEEQNGLFVVMEFVNGRSIESTLALNGDAVEVKAVLQVVWRIAAGLAAIHKAGIIHRDIKPANLMLGDGLRVKIMDFGVAARAGTAASMRLGTTKYMAPELFGGEQEVDGRADIYSLGMIAYEMLLGRTKFNEIFNDVVRDSHSEALRWMKWHSSPELTAPALSEVNPEMPAALSAIVARMMAKDPAQRYADVESLGRDIRANFSPRGSARAAGGPPPRRRVGLETAAEAEGRGVRAAVLSSGDSGELSVEPAVNGEGPATAAIPRQPTPLGRKLIVAGSIAALAVVALVVLLVVQYNQREQVRRDALDKFDSAMRTYKQAAKNESRQGKSAGFTTSLEAFRRIGDDQEYRGKASSVVSRALVMGWLTRAQLGVLAGDNNEADQSITRAQDTNRNIQRTHDELYDWTQSMESEFSDFNTYWLSQREFKQRLDGAQQNLADGKLEVSLTAVEQARKLNWLMTEQRKELDSLREDIIEKQKQKEFYDLLSQGETAEGAGKPNDAMTAYTQALGVLEKSKADLPENIYTDLKTTADKRIADLKLNTEYALAMNQAQQAKNQSNLLIAADWLEKANKLKPGKALENEIRDLRWQHWMNIARKARTDNKYAEVEAAVKKAEEIKPTPEGANILRLLEDHKSSQAMVAKGDTFMAAKNWAAALEAYSGSTKGGRPADADLTGKINECRFQIALADGERFRAAGELDKAIAEYRKAIQFKPNDPQPQARIDLMMQEKQYLDQVSQAEAARAKGDFSGARAKYKAARKILAKPELDGKLRDLDYEENVQKAKSSMDDKQWQMAMAYLNAAKRAKESPEIDKLVKVCQDELNKQGSP